MHFDPLKTISIPQTACPPKSWAWLSAKTNCSYPVIRLIVDSELCKEFRKMAWDEFQERKRAAKIS